MRCAIERKADLLRRENVALKSYLKTVHIDMHFIRDVDGKPGTMQRLHQCRVVNTVACCLWHAAATVANKLLAQIQTFQSLDSWGCHWTALWTSLIKTAIKRL